ncbi:MAG: endo-1,4-beta-xylanase [Bacteroidales bacterium]
MNLKKNVILAMVAIFSAHVYSQEATLLASNARFNPYNGEISTEGGLYFTKYGGFGDWFEFEQTDESNITIQAKGTVCTRGKGGYPLVHLIIESHEGDVLYSTKFKVYESDFHEYQFKFKIPHGSYFVSVFYLKGPWESKGDNLTVHDLRISNAKLAETTPRVKTVKELTDPSIQKYRMGELIIKSKPGEHVKVTQLQHDFQFGTSISRRIFMENEDPNFQKDVEKYNEILKANFNSATPAILYWHRTEEIKNKPDFSHADEMYQWCKENDLSIRGHCIFWGCNIENRMQPWIEKTDDSELRMLIKRRAEQVTSRYKGLIKEYDLNNEMVHHSYFRNRLADITRDMAYFAKKGDPDAKLFVNDFNIFCHDALDEYVQLIRELLDNDIPIDGIGIQGHLENVIDYRHIWSALEELSQFNLPIRITEIDVNVGDEALQAKALEDVYRACFAHPNVIGITMWDFWETVH